MANASQGGITSVSGGVGNAGNNGTLATAVINTGTPVAVNNLDGNGLLGGGPMFQIKANAILGAAQPSTNS